MSLRRVAYVALVLMTWALAPGAVRAQGNATPQPPLDYYTIFNTIRNFRGLICPSGTFLIAQCLTGGITIGRDGTLVLAGDNGDRSRTVPLLGLKATMQDSGLKGHFVAINGAWDLMTEARDQQSAQQLADALTQLPRRATEYWESGVATLAVAHAYRALPVKPVLGEDARRYLVQAEDAVKQGRYRDAVTFYGDLIKVASWWPGGYLNQALVFAEAGEFHSAVIQMHRYLEFVPDAPNARELRDKTYIWESKDTSGIVEPDPAWFLPPLVPGGWTLRVGPVPPIVAAAWHLPQNTGMMVVYAQSDLSPSARFAPEDIILSLGGQPVASLADFGQALKNAPRGTDVPVAIARGPQRLTLTVRLTEAPRAGDAAGASGHP